MKRTTLIIAAAGATSWRTSLLAEDGK